MCDHFPVHEQGPNIWIRLALLCASASLGALIGAIGHALSGHPQWYLAIPGAIALIWLRVADISRCDPSCRPPDQPPKASPVTDDRPSSPTGKHP
jgi:hypothetical protein